MYETKGKWKVPVLAAGSLRASNGMGRWLFEHYGANREQETGLLLVNKHELDAIVHLLVPDSVLFTGCQRRTSLALSLSAASKIARCVLPS